MNISRVEWIRRLILGRCLQCGGRRRLECIDGGIMRKFCPKCRDRAVAKSNKLVLTFHFEQVPEQLKWTGECLEIGVGAYADTLLEAQEFVFDLVILHLKAQRDVLMEDGS